MEHLYTKLNQAREELNALRAFEDTNFKVITADNIEDYLHHHAEEILVQKRINECLIEYMLK